MRGQEEAPSSALVSPPLGPSGPTFALFFCGIETQLEIPMPSSSTTTTLARTTGITHAGSAEERLGGEGGIDGDGGRDGEGGSCGAPSSVMSVKFVSTTASAPKRYSVMSDCSAMSVTAEIKESGSLFVPTSVVTTMLPAATATPTIVSGTASAPAILVR